MSKRRKRATCKEGEDGLLYQLRDDGRVRLLGREKALDWARRRAPAALGRIREAYDRVAATLPTRENVLRVLEEGGWEFDGEGYRRSGPRVVRAKLADCLSWARANGLDSLRRYLARVDPTREGWADPTEGR